MADGNDAAVHVDGPAAGVGGVQSASRRRPQCFFSAVVAVLEHVTGIVVPEGPFRRVDGAAADPAGEEQRTVFSDTENIAGSVRLVHCQSLAR